MLDLSTQAATWLLEHPLDYAGAGGIPRQYVHHRTELDGAILTATLAVDR